jgi:lipoate-protein ligase A
VEAVSGQGQLNWAVSRRSGPAGELHGLEVPSPAARAAWFMESSRPALVLGSTQPVSSVDEAACAAAGIEVVRRRSGGGAVLVGPGAVLWVDVIVPAGDGLWDDDVGRAVHWLGEVWVRALAAVGVSDATVHRGPMVTTGWSRWVCFAGLGPGEVTRAGRKVVGISQRRTRAAARFQCAVLATWDGEAIARLVHPPASRQRPTIAELTSTAAGVGADALVELAPAFLAALPTIPARPA